MAQKNTGFLKNSFVMVNWTWECPIHSGVTNLSFPPGSNPYTHATEYMAELLFCPSGVTGIPGSGHTFPMEMANATIYSATDSNTTTGTGLQASSSVLYSGVPVLQYLSWQ